MFAGLVPCLVLSFALVCCSLAVVILWVILFYFVLFCFVGLLAAPLNVVRVGRAVWWCLSSLVFFIRISTRILFASVIWWMVK